MYVYVYIFVHNDFNMSFTPQYVGELPDDFPNHDGRMKFFDFECQLHDPRG